MAFTRPGAPVPTSSVSNAQSLANRSVQTATGAASTAMQAASPSVPVEITGADGQHFTVSFGDVRNFICPKATDAECKIFLETCKQYHLNPFTKEAYLIHYDNKTTTPPAPSCWARTATCRWPSATRPMMVLKPA